MGPTIASGTIWGNFTIVHPTIETLKLLIRPYLNTSTEIYKYLPNLKRVEMMFRSDFRYDTLKHVTDQLEHTENLYYFWIYPYYVPNTAAETLVINNWGPLFSKIKNKITNFEFYEHYTIKPFYL